MLVCLFWTIIGALLHKLLNHFLMKRESRHVYDRISLYSLNILYRIKKSLDIFAQIRTKHLADTPLTEAEKEASIKYYQVVSTMEMEMMSSVIYNSFPESYKKFSLYTNWSEAKEIINKMEKNKIL